MQSIATLLWQWVITWKVSHQQGTAFSHSATQCIVSQCAVLCWCVLQCVAVCCSVPNRCGFCCETIPAPVLKIWNNRQLVYSDLDRGRLAAACCMYVAWRYATPMLRVRRDGLMGMHMKRGRWKAPQEPTWCWPAQEWRNRTMAEHACSKM